jgi:hypothetical protein
MNPVDMIYHKHLLTSLGENKVRATYTEGNQVFLLAFNIKYIYSFRLIKV